MDPLGDPLTTHPIKTSWECTIEPYTGSRCGFIDNPDRQFSKGSVWTRTRTRSDGSQPLLTHDSFDYLQHSVSDPPSWHQPFLEAEGQSIGQQHDH
jgi:hypothetical protein